MSTTTESTVSSNQSDSRAPVGSAAAMPKPLPAAFPYPEKMGLGMRLLSVFLVLVVLAVIVYVLERMLVHGPDEMDATDVVAILSPIMGAVTTIAAAGLGVATGIAAGSAAGAAAGNMAASAMMVSGQAAMDETQRKQQQLNEANMLANQMTVSLEKIKTLEAQLDLLVNLQRGRFLKIPGVRQVGFDRIDPKELNAAYADLVRIQGELDAMTRM